MTRNWKELYGYWEKERNFACVGLDPVIDKIPECLKKDVHFGMIGGLLFEFNRQIIEATRDIIGIYKPNIAFYEVLGDQGMIALKDTIDFIHSVVPLALVILDAKYGDPSDRTNAMFAALAFDHLGADGVTLQCYPGAQALKPFLERKDKLCIPVAKTSNKGAGEFQDLPVRVASEDVEGVMEVFGIQDDELVLPIYMPLYQYVAYRIVKKWNTNGNCALVVGATYPKDLETVRVIAPDLPILIPGVGTQGGDLAASVEAGLNSKYGGIIVNSSSGIIHASSGDDFAEAARAKTIELIQGIRGVIFEIIEKKSPRLMTADVDTTGGA